MLAGVFAALQEIMVYMGSNLPATVSQGEVPELP